MNRFIVMVMALGMAFGAGWLFSNEVRAPLLEDVGLAMWMAVGGVAVIAAVLVSTTR